MMRATLTALVLGVVLTTLAAIGLIAARADPVMRHAAVQVRDWPRGAPPIKIALISDIHIGGPVMTTARLDRIVDAVNAQHPDIILLAGDFVNGHDGVAWPPGADGLVRPLSRLHSSFGKLAVLGNHDHWTAPAAIRAALARAQVKVVENEAIEVGPVTIVGIGDVFSGHDQVRQAITAAGRLQKPHVILSHSPDVARKVSGGDLILAGHTHCGQILIPLVGSLATYSLRDPEKRLYDPQFRCGLSLDGQRTVIVTAGVGAGTVPFRLGSRSDWWLIEIGPSEPRGLRD